MVKRTQSILLSAFSAFSPRMCMQRRWFPKRKNRRLGVCFQDPSIVRSVKSSALKRLGAPQNAHFSAQSGLCAVQAEAGQSHDGVDAGCEGRLEAGGTRTGGDPGLSDCDSGLTTPAAARASSLDRVGFAYCRADMMVLG